MAKFSWFGLFYIGEIGCNQRSGSFLRPPGANHVATASYHLGPFPRLRPCVAWQGSKGTGDHPEKYSSPQLRRLCLGDVKASGGNVLLVPMTTLCTGDLEECGRGARETGELLMSSSSMLRQRRLESYVIINKATWLGDEDEMVRVWKVGGPGECQVRITCTPPELRPGPCDDAPIHSPQPSPFDTRHVSTVSVFG